MADAEAGMMSTTRERAVNQEQEFRESPQIAVGFPRPILIFEDG
jgi:hypothetical protein